MTVKKQVVGRVKELAGLIRMNMARVYGKAGAKSKTYKTSRTFGYDFKILLSVSAEAENLFDFFNICTK